MLLRNSGHSGIAVSGVGFGCMGLSELYGEPAQDAERRQLRLDVRYSG